MENSERVYKYIVKVIYFAIMICMVPITIFSFEYFFNVRTPFFKFSMVPATFLMVYCPIICLISSFLLIGLLKGKKRIFGLLLFLFTIIWYLWFYNLIKDQF